MLLKYSTYEDLAKKIKIDNRKIVIYGAGMIGTVLIPYLIEKYDLFENLLCYFDGDKKKHGTSISICNIEYAINSPEKLRELSFDTVILITNSNYYQIVKMMDAIEELNNNEAYIIPILQVLNTHKEYKQVNLKKSSKPLIPKRIHYCWFSGNPMPDYLKKCIDSWYRFCPDYEIIRWDESNYDVEKNPYMKQAYETKKWGFVPDVARLDILYEHGGIYLDTDVELVKSLDDLLYQYAFAGVEKWGNINMGGCSGAIPKHPIIKKMLDFRINEQFIMDDGSLNQTTCGYYETKPLMMIGMKPSNTIQYIEDMTIYSSDFFQPYDYMSGETHMTDNTFSIHHFDGGWLDVESVEERKRTMELYNLMLKRMKDSIENNYC
ncbi:MAG: hypothetical protein J6K43_03115 [Lachnospiraceae bacterium]|nr:hypothetical protein [Lachnospiraceae bacterium]